MTSSSIENTERLEALSVCGGVDYSEKSDLDLVNLMCDGDGDAFVEIVSRYETKLIAYSRRYVGSLDLAKDICQEVFLKLIGKPPATLQNDNLGPWLFRVSHNLAIDVIRRRKFELTGESLPEVTGVGAAYNLPFQGSNGDNVYLPDGYDKGDQKYPVVYLFHGMYGGYSDWVKMGNMKELILKI